MRKVFLLFALLLFSVNIGYAADLDQPMEKKITIKSEIERGAALAQKFILKNIGKPTQFANDVQGAIAQNQQEQKDTEGFYLGLYMVAWEHLVSIKPLYKWEIGFAYADVYYKKFKPIQAKYELTDEQLCELVQINYNEAKPLFDEYWKKTHPSNNQ